MKDEHKTKGQLLEEMASLQERVAELEAACQEAKEAVKEKQRRLEEILDAIPDRVWIADDDCNIHGCKCYDYFKEPYEKRCSHCWSKHALSGETYSKEVHDESTGQYLEFFDAPLHNPDGSVFMFEIFRDITARKQTEEALVRSEARYRQAIENAQGVPYQLRYADNQYEFMGHGIEYMTGYKVEEFTPALFGSLLKESVVLRCPKNTRKLLETCYEARRRGDEKTAEETARQYRKIFINNPNEYTQLDFRIQTRDGQEKWLSDNIMPFKDEKTGKVTGLLGILQDITERKRQEEALARSEAVYRQAIENARGVPYQLRWPEGSYTFMGSGIEELIGFRPSELTRTKFNSLIEDIVILSGSKKAEDLLRSYFKALLRGDSKTAEKKMGKYQDLLIYGEKEQYQADILVRTKSGTLKWLSDCNVPVEDEKTGEATGVIGILQDITERKRAEEKIRNYQEQLRSLASELLLTETQQRRQIAQELHDQIGQTLAMAKIKLGPLSQGSFAGGNGEMVAGVGELIDQAIQYTRSLTFELSPPILYELGLEAALEWLCEQTEKHGIKTLFASNAQAKPLTDDIRMMLFQAVRELLMNVVKHARAKEVKVSVGRDEDHIRIEVDDDGRGFNVKKAKPPGSTMKGFGLFNINERLDYIGGALEIESQENRGTRITLTAPLKIDK